MWDDLFEQAIREELNRLTEEISGKADERFVTFHVHDRARNFRKPKPREGYIDARRDDGCVPDITSLPKEHHAMRFMRTDGHEPVAIVRRETADL